MSKDLRQSLNDNKIDKNAYRPIDNKSHVKGPNDDPLWHITIPQLLQRAVDKDPQQIAVIYDKFQVYWTYLEFQQRVKQLAVGLLGLGLKKGDRIGIWSPNRPEWLLIQYASAELGLILVNVNPAYRHDELVYALNKVGCRCIVIAEPYKKTNYPELIREAANHCPKLEKIIIMGKERFADNWLLFDELSHGAPANAQQLLHEYNQQLDADEPINIQFTSGTTGNPKGATLSHYNIVNNGRFVVKSMNFSAKDRLVIPVPLYHCFGMVMGSLGCVSVGATMIFPSETFDATATMQAIATHKATALYAVPTMFLGILEHADLAKYDLSSLRTGIMAGAPCPIEVMRRVINELHCNEITIAYGMTETSPVSFQTHTDEEINRRCTTVGLVHPHVEVKIINDKGMINPIGIAGELCTRGYSVMHGYWADNEQTKDCLSPAQWMHTGDLAVMDGDGYVKIVGRIKDMIIRGGENIYPREIEEFLFTHPKIFAVQVFGVPDEKYGEQCACFILLKDGQTMTEAELKEFCTNKIAHYKIPHYVRFVKEIPMTVTGKPQKFIMRDMMIKELKWKQ